MNLVNELFQNIRFLKYYGWGEDLVFAPFTLTSLLMNTVQKPDGQREFANLVRPS